MSLPVLFLAGVILAIVCVVGWAGSRVVDEWSAPSHTYTPSGGDPWEGYVFDDDPRLGRSRMKAQPQPEPQFTEKSNFEKIYGCKEEKRDYEPCPNCEPKRTKNGFRTAAEQQTFDTLNDMLRREKERERQAKREQAKPSRAPQLAAPDYNKRVKEFLNSCRGKDKRDILRQAAWEFHPDRLEAGMKPYGNEMLVRVQQELEKWR
jgi:hypothetical protein